VRQRAIVPRAGMAGDGLCEIETLLAPDWM